MLPRRPRFRRPVAARTRVQHCNHIVTNPSAWERRLDAIVFGAAYSLFAGWSLTFVLGVGAHTSQAASERQLYLRRARYVEFRRERARASVAVYLQQFASSRATPIISLSPQPLYIMLHRHAICMFAREARLQCFPIVGHLQFGNTGRFWTVPPAGSAHAAQSRSESLCADAGLRGREPPCYASAWWCATMSLLPACGPCLPVCGEIVNRA